VRILIATDSFPPNCGGSGWSTWELARGLRARGHAIVVIQPRPGTSGIRSREYDGFTIEEFGAAAPPVPFVRNYFKNERLFAALEAHLLERLTRDRPDVVHAQHVLTASPAIAAARKTDVPVVVTVRDYWPVCYWATLLVDPAIDALCPECSAAGMRRCLQGRVGPAWPVAATMIPYMQRNLARKRTSLASANAVIAVSAQIGRDLRARAPELRETRLEIVPNPFDLASLAQTALSAPPPRTDPYALYVGKLEANKGADLLPRTAHAAGLRMPLIVVGDGSLRPSIEHDSRELGVDLQVTGWLSRDAALGWMASAAFVVFPSRGPESLSRVLVEASALGVPAAAMDTGGTRDIIEPDRTGLLSTDPAGLARDVRRLAEDQPLRQHLGAAAASHARDRFDGPRVVARIESIYDELVTASHRSRP